MAKCRGCDQDLTRFALGASWQDHEHEANCLSSKLEQSQLEIARLEAQHSQGLREDEKRERAHELALAALANRDARIAEQNETIRQLNEAVELWMERAGRGAP